MWRVCRRAYNAVWHQRVSPLARNPQDRSRRGGFGRVGLFSDNGRMYRIIAARRLHPLLSRTGQRECRASGFQPAGRTPLRTCARTWGEWRGSECGQPVWRVSRDTAARHQTFTQRICVGWYSHMALLYPHRSEVMSRCRSGYRGLSSWLLFFYLNHYNYCIYETVALAPYICRCGFNAGGFGGWTDYKRTDAEQHRLHHGWPERISRFVGRTLQRRHVGCQSVVLQHRHKAWRLGRLSATVSDSPARRLCDSLLRQGR